MELNGIPVQNLKSGDTTSDSESNDVTDNKKAHRDVSSVKSETIDLMNPVKKIKMVSFGLVVKGIK